MSDGSARRWRFGLLGHPVGHSVSPAIHEAALKSVGLEGSYAVFDVLPGTLGPWVERLRVGDFDGFNITVPHKVEALAAADGVADAAARIGAVNTYGRGADGQIMAHNTDFGGLARALHGRWPRLRDLGGADIVIYGAGGAARAAAMVVLATAPAPRRLTIRNRTAARAEAFVASLQGFAGEVTLAVESWGRTPVEGAAAPRLVIQATTQGMGEVPGTEGYKRVQDDANRLLKAAGAGPETRLLDLVYRPVVTPWVAAARALGLDADSGVEMLIFQAHAAFEIWTGICPDLQAMREAAYGALGVSPAPPFGSGEAACPEASPGA